MINVSDEFWELMQERTDFKENAEITLADGMVLELDEDVFTISNNSVTDAAGVNSIPLGVALARNIQIELMNDDKRFSTYDFFGAKVRLYLKFELSETIERIEYGYFTVVDPVTYGTTVIISAIDDMYKADKVYSTNLSFPQKATVVLQDCCSSCDILLGTTEFLNSNFEIQSMPVGDYTHRQIIGFVAMIACGNARINREGSLEILSYDFSFLNEDVDGGSFNPWNEGYIADGGTFNPWDTGDALDGGKFAEKNDYHTLYNFKNLRVDTDDVVITGLQTKYEAETDGEMEEKTILIGEEGYVLSIENPLISGQEESALQLMSNALVGGRMRKFEGDHIGYPIAEFMDNAFVLDREGNSYGTVLTDVNFTFFGFTTFKNSAQSAVRNASQYQTPNAQAIIAAQKLINKEAANRNLAIEKLNEKLTASSGLYMTEEEQEDGSKIYYAHDKKTIEESQIIWKYTAQAIGISLDGGETYPYGLTATGTAILDMIYVIGLNADYIKTGRISDKNNKNYWDLVEGILQISNGVVKVSGQVVFSAEDYADEDLTIVQEIINGTREMTQEYMQKYDFTGKGFIDSSDLLKVRKLIAGNPTEYTLDISVEINGLTQNSVFKTGGVLIGMNGMYSKNVGCGVLNFKETQTVNESGAGVVGATGSFTTANGKTINVTNGIITGIA